MTIGFKCYRILLVSALPLVVGVGCSQQSSIPDPPAPSIVIQDELLREFVSEKLLLARQNRSSGLHRGRLAMTYDANGFSVEAIETYSQAEKLSPKNFRWPYLKAHLFASLGEIEAALLSLDDALKVRDDYVPAYIARGSWLLDVGDYQKALSSLSTARDFVLDLSQTQAVNALSAQAQLRLENPAQAIELLVPYAGEDTHPYIARTLVQSYRMLGNPKEASRFTHLAESSAELQWADPEASSKLRYVQNFSGLLLLAEELIEQKNALEAIQILEQLRSSYPQEESVLNNLGIAYRIHGDRGKAIALALSALESYPESHLLHFNLGVIYEEMKQLEKALNHLGDAIRLKPDLLPAYERKVQLLVHLERLAEAYESINVAIEQTNGNADMFYLAGILAGMQDDWVQSVGYFDRVVKLDPQHPNAYANLIRSLVTLGRYSEATKSFEKAKAVGVPRSELASLERTLAEIGPVLEAADSSAN